jgi:hypothetical protein
MAKKKKEQDKKVVFRVTCAWGTELRDYLITAEWYEVDSKREDTIHLFKSHPILEYELVASFRFWIAIENLKEAEEWGERFEKLDKIVQTDMFEATSSELGRS